jgi:hypothetical protein
LAAVDLDLLVVFDAVMQERNGTRAGDRLGLSQPAMSHVPGRLRHPRPRRHGFHAAGRTARRLLLSSPRIEVATIGSRRLDNLPTRWLREIVSAVNDAVRDPIETGDLP